ncbi:MAG: FAD/NAD(P)-binding protein [Phycisphaerales bacterium]
MQRTSHGVDTAPPQFPPPGVFRIAIIGAGFSGSMLALHLSRAARPDRIEVLLFEKCGVFAPGLAYGQARSTNLLNVPAGNMSALPDDPDHFLRWAQQRDAHVTGGDFLPRRLYGQYLRAVLDHADAANLCRVHADVRDVTEQPDGSFDLAASDARRWRCDSVVLCVGNSPPSQAWLRGVEISSQEPLATLVQDPWAPAALDGLAAGDAGEHQDVLLVGAGLTMVDIVTELRARGHKGVIHALSRRGILPAAHRSPSRPPAHRAPLVDLSAWDGRARSLVRLVRAGISSAAARGVNWREVIASLRGATPDIWRRMNPPEQDTFLRHLRTYWDAARHRLAPRIADHIAAEIDAASLVLHAGRIRTIRPAGEGVEVSYQPRRRAASPLHPPSLQRLRVARVINCTGPECDINLIGLPVIDAMLRHGLIRPDRHRIGIDCTPEGQVIRTSGDVNQNLWVLGPARRGALWETTAVPELRTQAASLAQTLASRAANRRPATPIVESKPAAHEQPAA